jgi:hypothetical protein
MHENEPHEPFFGGFAAHELLDAPPTSHQNGNGNNSNGMEPQKPKAASGINSRTNYPVHTQFEIILDRLKKFRLVLSDTGQPYIVVPLKGHLTPLFIGDGEFDDYLSVLAEREKMILKRDARSMVKQILRGHCSERGEPVELALRMAGSVQDDKPHFYVDLGDTQRRLVRVTADGWEVLEGEAANRVPVMFRRLHAMLPMPVPARLDDAERAAVWQEFRDLIQPGSEENWVKMIAWILNCFRAPTAPYVGLCINGQEGSGKTTRSRMLRMLVDPHRMKLIGEVRERKDFEPIVNSTFALAFENLSRIEQWLSDALCMIATEGCFPVRTLFTTMDLTIMTALRPMLVNGITDFIQRPDLKRRFLFCEVPPFGRGIQKVGDKKLAAQFEALQPRLMGAIFDAVAAAMRHSEDEEIAALDWGEGIPDFAAAVAGAEKAGMLPWKENGHWRAVYLESMQNTAAASLNESPVAQAVIALLDWCEATTGQARFVSEASMLYPRVTQVAAWQMLLRDEILETEYRGEGGSWMPVFSPTQKAEHIRDLTPVLDLRELIPEHARHNLNEKGARALSKTNWPKSAIAFGQKLRREQAGLRAAGVEIKKPYGNHSTTWILERLPKIEDDKDGNRDIFDDE